MQASLLFMPLRARHFYIWNYRDTVFNFNTNTFTASVFGSLRKHLTLYGILACCKIYHILKQLHSFMPHIKITVNISLTPYL
jgi:hypothetical protein